MGLLTFPIGVLLPIALYAAFGTFWLGQVEHAWGAWGSFQVMLWVGIVAGLFATVPFGVAASVMGRYPSALLSMLLGVGVSCISLVSMWLMHSVAQALVMLVILFFALSAAAPLFCGRRRVPPLLSTGAAS
jgi:hypothetical protein